MADGSWYYVKGGQRVGPFAFAQLQQLAAAGAVAPDDPVARDGDLTPAAAAAVPGLFPPPTAAAAVPRGGPTVLCPKCRGRVDEAAEECPHCRHPQAPRRAREPDRELVPCPACGVRNDLARHYYPGGDCRGCGQPLAAVHPDRVFDHRLNDAYRESLGWQAGVRWVALPMAGLIGGFAVGELFRRPTWPYFVGGGVLAVSAADFLLPVVYYLTFIAGRRNLPAPHADRVITLTDWRAAGRQAAAVRRTLPAKMQAVYRGWPWWAYTGLIAVGLVAAAGVDADIAANRRALAALAADAARADQISATKADGFFSHEIRLHNDGPLAFGACDLTITVSYSSGREKIVEQAWTGWAVGERKSVTVPADGRVDRVRVLGRVHDAGTESVGWLVKTLDWPAGRR